jgi:hypothetical protein
VVVDVFIGSALACGGFCMALLVYIFNKGKYHPLVRPALLSSLFGYTLAGAAITFDLGRWWNFWHIFWPGYFNVRSVMFEVAACITLYIIVMWIEFTPVFLEKMGLRNTRKKLNKVLLPTVYVAPVSTEDEGEAIGRIHPEHLPVSARVRNFEEVDLTPSENHALCEARRCLRCDIEFTEPVRA